MIIAFYAFSWHSHWMLAYTSSRINELLGFLIESFRKFKQFIFITAKTICYSHVHTYFYQRIRKILWFFPSLHSISNLPMRAGKSKFGRRIFNGISTNGKIYRLTFFGMCICNNLQIISFVGIAFVRAYQFSSLSIYPSLSTSTPNIILTVAFQQRQSRPLPAMLLLLCICARALLVLVNPFTRLVSASLSHTHMPGWAYFVRQCIQIEI